MRFFSPFYLFSLIISISFAVSSLESKESLSIVADQIIYKNNGAILTAVGNVKISYKQYELRTPKLTFDKTANKLSATNPIELRMDEKLTILASSAQISSDFKTIITEHVSALIEKKFFVKSDKVEQLSNGNSVFYSSVGTTCEVCLSSPTPMWQIKSEKIYHDPAKRQLSFRNAWMEFMGAPLIYTPYLRIPEPGIKRATGLLTPKILTSNLLGVGLKQPYYIKIDKSSDMTVSIVKTSKTNLLLEAEYRKLLNKGEFTISGAVKPPTSESLVDGYFQLNGNAKISQTTNLSFDTTAVSDSGFLGRYGYNDTDRLTSKIAFNQQRKNSYSEISATYFTSFRDNFQEEYIVAPNFYTRYFRNIHSLGLSTGTEISLVALTRANLENNVRFNTSVDANREFKIGRGLAVTGTAKLSANLYRKQKNNSKVRLLQHHDPTLAIELNAPVFRELDNRLDVIKPTLQLIYNPDLRINDEIPIIDSQQVKLDQTSLFSLNRFSGLDKQEAGLRLNAGAQYSVKRNGPFSYDLALGQIFRSDRSNQFSEGSGLSGIKSDILISGNVNYKSLVTLHGQQLYDQALNLKQAETILNFERDDKKLSGGLIYLEADPNENRPENITELTLGVDSNLTYNWIGSLDLRRNLKANENINAALRFSYENECSRINLSFIRRFTETNALPADTRVELSFDLTGLNGKRSSNKKSNCVIYN